MTTEEISENENIFKMNDDIFLNGLAYFKKRFN